METKILMLKGEKGDPGGSTWGNIDGTLSDQTDLKSALDAKAATSELGAAAFSNSYNDLDDRPTLKTVATTGSYNDLTNKPTIPTIDQLLDLVYPVGSYYWSSDSTNPGTVFGVGTWTQIQDKFIYAAGTKTVGDTGGEETHTLTIGEIPSHTHGIYSSPDSIYAINSYTLPSTHFARGNDFTRLDLYNALTDRTGGGGSHNNMPPYLVAYCFKRTA